MKLHSKWYYLLSGLNFGEAFVFALAHQGLIMTLCFGGGVFNWYLAERRLKEEQNG